MRAVFVCFAGWACLAALLFLTPVQAQSTKRYEIEPDLVTYPQGTPKDTLGSLLRAIDRRRVDYLLSQLADPAFVDKRVKEYGGNFQELVRETKTKLVDDPDTLKKLQLFLKDGEWEGDDSTQSAKVKGAQERVFMRKIGERWYFENRTKVEEPAK